MLNSTNAFDLTQYTITQDADYGFVVKVTEGDISLILVTDNGDDLMKNAIWNLGTTLLIVNGRVKDLTGVDKWTADRIAFVFSLASRKIRQHLCTA